jgi:hypothetical protein
MVVEISQISWADVENHYTPIRSKIHQIGRIFFINMSLVENSVTLALASL